MSNYNPAFLSGSTGDAAELDRLLESDVPSKFGISSATSTGTISGATFVDTAVLTSVTVEADELLHVEAEVNFSHNTEVEVVEFGLFVDGTKVTNKYIGIPEGLAVTSAQTQGVALSWMSENISGSITIKAQARVSAGAGTLYVGVRHIKYSRTKKRA